ncbi:MAG: MFS transporter [Deltaproteobacteria bacterium]|nr:MAG: MFS transporter [Deltaproteobacteria bacterium]
MNPLPPVGLLDRDPPKRRELVSWMLFDFSNNAVPLVIVTAVYVLYFKGVVVGGDDPNRGDMLWGVAISLSAFVVALTAPFMGALADARRWRKRLLLLYTAVCVVGLFGLGMTGPGTILLAIVTLVVVNASYEGGLIFYHSLLPSIARPEEMGRISGMGWAAGYIGGLIALGISLPFALAGNIRVVIFIVAASVALLCIPLFVFVRERAPALGGGARAMLGNVAHAIRTVRSHRDLLFFFLAFFVYNDAIVTTFTFAAPFATDSLGYTQVQIIALIMGIQVTAATGAFTLGRLADRIGSAVTIRWALRLFVVSSLAAFLCAWPFAVWETRPELRVAAFAVTGLSFGFMMGATQAASRSFLASVIPPERSGEFFGVYGLVGRFSAVLGPLAFGVISFLTGTQVWSVAFVVLLFTLGLVLLGRVDEERLRAELRGEGAA